MNNYKLIINENKKMENINIYIYLFLLINK